MLVACLLYSVVSRHMRHSPHSGAQGPTTRLRVRAKTTSMCAPLKSLYSAFSLELNYHSEMSKR